MQQSSLVKNELLAILGCSDKGTAQERDVNCRKLFKAFATCMFVDKPPAENRSHCLTNYYFCSALISPALPLPSTATSRELEVGFTILDHCFYVRRNLQNQAQRRQRMRYGASWASIYCLDRNIPFHWPHTCFPEA